jgi:hypothetical protein
MPPPEGCGLRGAGWWPNYKHEKVQGKKRRKRKLRDLGRKPAETTDSIQRRNLIQKIRRISACASVPDA